MHPRCLVEYRIGNKVPTLSAYTAPLPTKGKTPDPIQDKGFYWLRE